MTELDPPILAAIALAFLLAGFVKGVIGMGLPTVAIGLLGLLMPPIQAAAILVVPSIITNLRQMLPLADLPARVGRLWPLLAGICVGVALGGALLDSQQGRGPTIALGVLLVSYAAVGLAAVRFRVPARAERPFAPAVGAVTGAIASGTGVFVIPMVPWLQATGLERDELVQSLGIAFMVSTLALGALLGTKGLLAGDLALASLGAVLPALLGQAVGERVRGRIPPDSFRRWFLIGLLALGVQLVVV